MNISNLTPPFTTEHGGQKGNEEDVIGGPCIQRIALKIGWLIGVVDVPLEVVLLGFFLVFVEVNLRSRGLVMD